MLSSSEALQLLHSEGLSEERIQHCADTKDVALALADKLTADGFKLDRNLIEIGALLHDIGRARDEGVRQGLEGYNLLKSHNLPEELCFIVRNHVGAGIPKAEAIKLGLPAEDFLPRTLEEKIVCYSDNIVPRGVSHGFDATHEYYIKKFGALSGPTRRFELLHEELERYVPPAWTYEVDKKSEEFGTPVVELMENAGRGIAERILQYFGDVKGKTIIALAGSGNNGGDAYVAADYLWEKEANVQILLFGEPKSDASKKNLEVVQHHKIPIVSIEKPKDLPDLNADFLIDGLLGTGIIGKIREPMRTAIEKFNAAEAYKVAIDLPSGINPDNGKVADLAIIADLTIAMHRIKKGCVGNLNCGFMEVVNIGIPRAAEEAAGL